MSAFPRQLAADFAAKSLIVHWGPVRLQDGAADIFVPQTNLRDIVRRLFVCAMIGPSTGLQSS
jgi:hypothetical protein